MTQTRFFFPCYTSLVGRPSTSSCLHAWGGLKKEEEEVVKENPLETPATVQSNAHLHSSAESTGCADSPNVH